MFLFFLLISMPCFPEIKNIKNDAFCKNSMDLQQMKAAVRRMQGLLQQPVEKEAAAKRFSFSRQESIDSQIQFNLKIIETQAWNLVELGKYARNRRVILESLFLFDELQKTFQDRKLKRMQECLGRIEKNLNLLVEEQVTVIVPKNIPAMVKREVEEDLQEIQRCLHANCFRSVVILCGRALETC